MSQNPKAPAHLSPATKAWWRRIVTEYDLQSHHLKILQTACESWDRLCQARTAIDEKGLTFEDRLGNVRPRPELTTERDCRIAFLRAVRELGLDSAEVESPRPPPLH